MFQRKWAIAPVLAVVSFACSVESESTITLPASDDDAVTGADDPDGGAAVGDVVESVEDTVEGAVEGATEAAKAQADELIEKIKGYLGEDKLDLAKQALATLESLQDKLPAAYQDKIQQVRDLIDASSLGDKAKKLGEGLGLGGD